MLDNMSCCHYIKQCAVDIPQYPVPGKGGVVTRIERVVAYDMAIVLLAMATPAHPN